MTGQEVSGEISWSRRYDHMQQHTGQHLLSAVWEELFQIPTLSFRMSEESSSIELGTKALIPEQVDAVILRATELARANPRLMVTFEDAGQAQGLRKASQRDGVLRIVEIPGVDRSACGGTHVACLAEVLPLQIRESEKVRGNVRLSFVCGNRAMSRTQSDFQTLARAAASLATSHGKLEERISALKQQLAESERQRLRLEAEAATRSGFDLYAATAPAADGIRRVFLDESIIDESVRTKVRAFVSQPRAVVLVNASDGLLLACSPDCGFNAGAVLKHALSKYGARGGGSATLAQGSLPDKGIIQDLISMLSPSAPIL
jgi:alanyl-tRNA synthetase